MWKRIRPLLILLSVTLNLAFVGVWAAHALSGRLRCPRGPTHGGEGVSCLLHRRLGTTEAQWRDIEPDLAEFRKSARAVCAEINRTRGELINLIADDEPDMEAIQAKQEEILAGQRRMQKLVISHLLSQKKALTQEQQKQLFEMLRRQSGCASHGPMMGIRLGEGSAVQEPCGSEGNHQERR